jgi:glycerol-3-phosphate dehydrogenase
VFGGKITTFRRLAEEASDMLCRALGWSAGAWTAGVPLPGGDIAQARFEPFVEAFAKRYAWLPAPLARRYARAYGTRASRMIGDAMSLDGLGEAIAPVLYEAELRYLRDTEWATCAEDVLWRRSKLGLHVEAGTMDAVTAAIDNWFARSRTASTHAPRMRHIDGPGSPDAPERAARTQAPPTTTKDARR